MEGNDDLNLKAINASVGRLVWVRLRNASWWPGQTLLDDQVPEDSPPNVGTPIKLLGRDDVDVEWYILEKSKNVKAFRCGEYDTHIDKAKAVAAAKACKKRTAKFTRRENAIITALEIEDAHLAKRGDHSLCSPSSPEAEHDGALVVPKRRRRRTPEDDGTEGIKRMRGLEDIGKEHVGAIVLYDRQEVGVDSVSNGEDKACSPLSLKRKRSQVINECSKKKNRRRQMTKVLESTSMVCVPVTSSGMEPVESMKSVSAVINNSSDSTCENASENVVGASHYSKAKDSDISSLSVSAEDDHSDQLYDVPLTGKDKHSSGLLAACTLSSSRKALVNGPACCTNPPDTQLVIYDLSRNIEKSTSEWQLKGKRNSRQMSKKQEARRFVYGEGALPLPALFEVKIEVKASSNKPRVPLVSRMSELNRKAIVGHPVSVEALEEDYCNGVVMMSQEPVVKAKSLPKKKSKGGAFGKAKKKSSSSVSMIKTRRLSTLTSQRVTGRSKMQTTTGKGKETVVACIPLKVVFSRINQVLKGSARQTQHRALPSAGKP